MWVSYMVISRLSAPVEMQFLCNRIHSSKLLEWSFNVFYLLLLTSKKPFINIRATHKIIILMIGLVFRPKQFNFEQRNLTILFS